MTFGPPCSIKFLDPPKLLILQKKSSGDMFVYLSGPYLPAETKLWNEYVFTKATFGRHLSHLMLISSENPNFICSDVNGNESMNTYIFKTI